MPGMSGRMKSNAISTSPERSAFEGSDGADAGDVELHHRRLRFHLAEDQRHHQGVVSRSDIDKECAVELAQIEIKRPCHGLRFRKRRAHVCDHEHGTRCRPHAAARRLEQFVLRDLPQSAKDWLTAD